MLDDCCVRSCGGFPNTKSDFLTVVGGGDGV